MSSGNLSLSKAPPLYAYQFVRAGSVDLTISGFFVDMNGNQVNAVFTGTISTTPITLQQLWAAAFPGTNIPTSAIALYGRLVNGTDTTGAYVTLSGNADGTISHAVDASGSYPILSPTDSLFLGVVSDASPTIIVNSSGGGGGGAVTVADGADVAQGAKANAAASSDTGTFSLISLFKRGLQGITALIAALPGALGAGGGIKVDGSGTSLPVTASGTVTANAGTGNFASTVADGANVTQGAKADSAATTDTGTFTLASLFKRGLQGVTTLIAALPAALGAGGGLKVDGSGTALPVSGTVTIIPSGTQTVTGTVTANAGTGTRITGGVAAVGAAQSGNPVAIGGVNGSGNMVVPQYDGNGKTIVVTKGTVATTANTNAGGFAAETGSTAQPLAASVFGYNGASYDAIRFANKFKTASATASGNTAVWTPAAGKKFRVLGILVQVTADAAALSGSDLTIDFQDSSTTISVTLSVFVPAVAVTTGGRGYAEVFIPLGNGILSAAANNVLNVNLSIALTSGKVNVCAIGVEE